MTAEPDQLSVSRKDVEEIGERLDSIRRRIAAAADRSGRPADAVQLVGVSKRQPAERVAAGVCAGIEQLGENYVQEAQAKRAAVAALVPAASPVWRMIGGLQRNKAGVASEIFDAVDTVDRASLARALDRRASERSRPIELLLQVNLSGEPQKGGCAEDEIEALLAACAPLAHVRVHGLMTVPAAAEDPEATRPVFARLRALRDELQRAAGGEDLRALSMGMSADFEVAVEEGATHVRVGTALFGPRRDVSAT